MIEPSPVRHHMTRRHDPVRLCDGQPADDDDIPATDIDALRDARAEATLCPVCQQNSHIHDYSLRPDRYHDGRRTLAHLYTVPVQYAFDGIRNCPHCRENPGNRTCRAWKEARKSVRVLHREARRIAKDVTDLDGVTGGCIATVYQFADGSVAASGNQTPNHCCLHLTLFSSSCLSPGPDTDRLPRRGWQTNTVFWTVTLVAAIVPCQREFIHECRIPEYRRPDGTSS